MTVFHDLAWKQTSVLFIDEISMMSPDLFDKLETIARIIRHCGRPFGGMQVIISGDWCQLPAVDTDVMCFKARSWNTVINDVVYLRENMRQNDPVFQQILAEIRMGVVTDTARKVLQSRLHADVGTEDIKPTKLYSHRKVVDHINREKMSELILNDEKEENIIQRFTARDYITSEKQIPTKFHKNWIANLNKSCSAQKVLDLCIGCQVMLIYNLDVEAGLVNGSRGAVVRFEEHRPVVKFINGIEMIIQVQEWDTFMSRGAKITRCQIPLILAWAVTIHRSQGATLDCVEIDLGETIFAPGQFYTGLSRVKALEYLSIVDLDFDGVKVDPEAEKFYYELENNQEI